MNIILLGASGFLGSNIFKRLKKIDEYSITGTCFKHRYADDLVELDISDDKQVKELFVRTNPDVVLWSLLNSDYSKEAELTHRGLTNVIRNMKKTSKLIYISTDGFTDGRGNYSEEDQPSFFDCLSPVNLYIKAKIEAEKIVGMLNNYVIARTGPMYGMDAWGRWDKRTAELINRLSNDREVIRTGNLYKTFVNVEDFAEALIEMIQIDFMGVIHIGSEMKESYYTCSFKIAEKLKLNTGLIREDIIKEDEAKQRCISLDTSMNTTKCREILKTRFRNLDEFYI